MFPELGLTKLDIAKYYEIVGFRRMLPHLRGRPLSALFCPGGVEEGCTYLRHHVGCGDGRGDPAVKLQEKTKVGEYMVVDTLEGLVSLAQNERTGYPHLDSTRRGLEHPDRDHLRSRSLGGTSRGRQVITAGRRR